MKENEEKLGKVLADVKLSESFACVVFEDVRISNAHAPPKYIEKF